MPMILSSLKSSGSTAASVSDHGIFDFDTSYKFVYFIVLSVNTSACEVLNGYKIYRHGWAGGGIEA